MGDEVEAKLALVRQENETLKQQLSESTSILDEERKKTEDMQFRLEELEILQSEGNKGGAEIEEDMKALRAKIISLEEESLTMKSDKEELEKSLENDKQKIEKMEKQTSGTQDIVKE